jgi:hypothetical protein
MATYLDLVNDVLIRLREPEVANVSDTTYSKLIGKFVNDAKRQVENAYDWNDISETFTFNTSASTYQYALTGVNSRYKILQVIDNTKNIELNPCTVAWFNRQITQDNPTNNDPYMYVVDGVNASRKPYLNLWPIPSGTNSINVYLVNPQNDLSDDTDVLYVPYEPVVLGAFARALVERGEDGGLNSSEAYQLFRTSLSDQIALESSRSVEGANWSPV